MKGLAALGVHASSPSSFLTGMPAPVRQFYVRGFNELSKLPESNYHGIVELIRLTFASLEEPNDTEIEQHLPGPVEARREAIGAGVLLGALISVADDDVEGTVEELSAAGLIEKDNQGKILGFAHKALGDGKMLKAALEMGRLGNKVLPSLVTFETTIDARLSFKEKRVHAATPVIVCFLDTDAPEQQIWFQMNPTQLSRLTKQLNSVLADVEVASSWLSRQGEQD